MLNARIRIYEVTEASPDNFVDTPAYTYARTAWGRVEPSRTPLDVTVAEGANTEMTARILFHDATPVGAHAVVVDPRTGDQWRIIGYERRQNLRLTEYTAQSAPQFALTGTPAGNAD